MPFTVRCKACSSSFAIPDEIWDKRVRGRLATLKCRSCKAEIEVDGTKPSLSQHPSSAPVSPADATDAGASFTTGSASSNQTPLTAKAGEGPASAKASEAASSIGSTGSREPILGVKPVAKAAEDVAAADLGWSMVPPAAELQSVGLSVGSGLAKDPKQTRSGAAARTAVAATTPSPEVQAAHAKAPVETDSDSAYQTNRSVTATKATKSVSATTQTKQTTASITTSAQPKQQTPKASDSAFVSNVITPASTATVANKSTTPALKAETRERAATAPTAAPVPAPSESEPSLADLWVVSYGDEDDRELTEKQIAAELVRGNITLSTIVWHEGMPEWMPISGVDALAKYVPAPKPGARSFKQSSAKSQPRSAVPQPASSTVGKSPGTTSAASTGSTTPRQAAATTNREPKSPLNARREAKSSPTIAEPAATQAPTLSRKPTPPPLPKSGVSHERPFEAEALNDALDEPDHETGASLVDPSAAKSGTRPPALPRRTQARPSPASPWDEPETEPVEDVFTSAPDVGAFRVASNEPRVSGSVSDASLTHPSPLATSAAVAPAGETFSAGATSAPATTPGKVSFPPPKPVQTATSTVMRTEASTGSNLISDEEFLAMQRRLPKWAIPVAMVAALVAIAGVVYLLQAKEELPPLPVAPVIVPTSVATANRRSAADPPSTTRASTSVVTPPAGSIGPTSNEKDFAKLFAQSVGNATGGFDPKAAESAAASALEAASRCRYAPDVPGRAQVVVTFATSGQVLSIQVAPPHTKTATGTCIVAALQPVKITPFQGRPGRLTLSVPLR